MNSFYKQNRQKGFEPSESLAAISSHTLDISVTTNEELTIESRKVQALQWYLRHTTIGRNLLAIAEISQITDNNLL
ncbi:MAG TPA: hypothetical protein VFN51_00750 [Candidatus Saccharimonadales bacterium]|nr:hypothetical protein [Candidatus Saccharimonadales bacterium]